MAVRILVLGTDPHPDALCFLKAEPGRRAPPRTPEVAPPARRRMEDKPVELKPREGKSKGEARRRGRSWRRWAARLLVREPVITAADLALNIFLASRRACPFSSSNVAPKKLRIVPLHLQAPTQRLSGAPGTESPSPQQRTELLIGPTGQVSEGVFATRCHGWAHVLPRVPQERTSGEPVHHALRKQSAIR